MVDRVQRYRLNRMKVYVVINLNNLRLDWGYNMATSGTQGSFLKTSFVVDGKRYYAKAPRFNEYEGFYGFETAYEVIAYRLARKLGVPCVKQEIQSVNISINGTVYRADVCVSESYRRDNQKKITLEDAVRMYGKTGENRLQTAVRIMGRDMLSKMLMFDFIIINRDRHGANIELFKCDSGGYRVAPLFDNGMSFLFYVSDDTAVRNFDITKDYNVNNYLGYHSLEKNLQFVDRRVKLNQLKRTDKASLFTGLTEILSKEHRDKIWDIIEWRYNYVASLQNNR